MSLSPLNPCGRLHFPKIAAAIFPTHKLSWCDLVPSANVPASASSPLLPSDAVLFPLLLSTPQPALGGFCPIITPKTLAEVSNDSMTLLLVDFWSLI